MGLKQGMNDIYRQGVYFDDVNNVLFEYKIFHTDVNEPDHIIVTNLRSGKTYGPMELPKELGILEGAKIILKDVSKNINKLESN
jgi:hypothetical protein